MKKYISTAIILIMTSCAGLLFISGESKKRADAKTPYILSMTKPVPIPDHLYFANEKLDLGRYDYREKYDREINGFTYLHSNTMLYLKRANRIFPIIEPILRKNGVPDDFKYLAVIESQLDPRAVSSAKAAGLWQFLATTGKEYGLEITSEVDERYHIEKSTEAACKYLKRAYQKYGDWSSVALSYNGGQGRISSELSKQYADKGLDLWLVDETTRYYFRMLAIKQIFENPSKYGFILSGDELYRPLEYSEMQVDYTIPDLAAFANENGVTYAQLKDFNSWLRDRKLTVANKPYILKIPNIKAMNYNASPTKIHNKAWIAAY